MIEAGIAFLAGLAGGYFLGRWVQRKRTAGESTAEILADAKAEMEKAAAKVKK